MFYSPLRYPGGKSKLTAYVLEIMKLNALEGGTYVEPFAGGCAIAWYLLINKHVRKVYINDLDPAIHAFWHSVLYRTDELCSLIDSSIITMEVWHKQRGIYRSNTSDLLKLGFATLFLNRTNRSGIIKAGVIGGKEQRGRYKIDCRFNKERIIEQIKSIAAMRDSIRLSNLDAT
ncbi:MAG: DNA adenine methylase, partial [Hafnia sp.]